MQKTGKKTKVLVVIFVLGILVCFMKIVQKDTREAKETINGTRKQNLKIYVGPLGKSFSPLWNSTEEEDTIMWLSYENLLQKDEKGNICNKKATKPFSSREKALAHISTGYDTIHNTTMVTISLNPNAHTPKGDVIRAKDLLFNFYLRCDAQVEGQENLYQGSIVGQKEYTYGTNRVENRQKEVEKLLKKPTTPLKEKLEQEIVKKQLYKELLWVKSLYENETYDFITRKYKEPKDLFAYYYSYNTKYSSQKKKEETVLKEIVKQYGWHYERLEKVTNKKYFKEAQRLALREILQDPQKDQVKTIRGIKLVNKRTISIALQGKNKDPLSFCNMWLLPLACYGDTNKYNGKDSFGFVKGHVEEIIKKTKESFMGTGPYYGKRTPKKGFLFQRNNHYHPGKANISQITIVEKEKEYEKEENMVEDLLRGKIDIAFTRRSSSLKSLLENYSTGAAYRIRQITWQGAKGENCFLYGTGYVNATSFPQNIGQYNTLFQHIEKLKVNE